MLNRPVVVLVYKLANLRITLKEFSRVHERLAGQVAGQDSTSQFSFTSDAESGALRVVLRETRVIVSRSTYKCCPITSTVSHLETIVLQVVRNTLDRFEAGTTVDNNCQTSSLTGFLDGSNLNAVLSCADLGGGRSTVGFSGGARD